MSETLQTAAPPVRVLIVNDETLLADACARVLRGEGYDVLTAASGGEALEVVRRDRPEIVLSDGALPDMEGMELLRGVMEAAPGAQVVMLTGFGRSAAGVDAVMEGAFAYLAKPFDAPQLRAMIGRAAVMARRPPGPA